MHEGQENAWGEIAICFNVAPDWQRGRCKFSCQIAERVETKQSRITFATHLTLISYLTIQLSFKKYSTSGTTAFYP